MKLESLLYIKEHKKASHLRTFVLYFHGECILD